MNEVISFDTKCPSDVTSCTPSWICLTRADRKSRAVSTDGYRFNKVKIVNIKTGEEVVCDSIEDASLIMGISGSAVCNMIKNNTISRSGLRVKNEKA